MQFFESVRWAPGCAATANRRVALRRFDDHRLELLVRRHGTSSHEHIAVSSKSWSSCYTCALITDHEFSGGVAERLIAPVLKTGRPKGLVSSNLTPSAPLDYQALTATTSPRIMPLHKRALAFSGDVQAKARQKMTSSNRADSDLARKAFH